MALNIKSNAVTSIQVACLLVSVVVYLTKGYLKIQQRVTFSSRFEGFANYSWNSFDDIKSENRTAPAERNVFYNRVPKTGSRSMLSVVRMCAKANNFTATGTTDFRSNYNETKVRRQTSLIATLAPPTFYQEHIYFLDFRSRGYEPPIYINMIRDPVNRFVSMYNFRKYGDASISRNKGMQDMNKCIVEISPYCNSHVGLFQTSRFLCGYEGFCMERSGVRKMVEVVKRRIDEDYLLVGFTEHFEDTLKLLEAMLPRYFKNASSLWRRIAKTNKKSTKTNKREILTAESEAILKKRMAPEYEVYNYAMEKFIRLKKQYGIP